MLFRSLGPAVSSNPALMQALQRQQATYQQRQQAAQDQGLADMEEGGDLSSLRGVSPSLGVDGTVSGSYQQVPQSQASSLDDAIRKLQAAGAGSSGGAVPPGVADPNKHASAPVRNVGGDGSLIDPMEMRGGILPQILSWTPGTMYASGGLTSLAKGRYLAGGTDGMADKINTTIDGDQPAKLSHGEFVVPADVVSHLGNGNSDAGAQRLYDMMDKIRKARTGTTKQGKQIKPDKYLPS